MLGTERLEESLFSLELVVEKLYIPHTPCRFPAIAFRLLDFPTIVIKHVEDDLGKAIRSKISLDSCYQLPGQFVELKDKHGNFMVKKGKSCLFRISADILKQHLANTPLYVMVIDMFPEVPKLVGNSTVPLNTLIDSICVDIAKLGSTVPSVHGDKGLFKLYNLMGKEIGYFVLGFRLLCLGPSLIPHLPESALIQRRSKGKQAKEDKRVDQMIQMQSQMKDEDTESDESVVELRNSACMTDPVKHDVLLQTVEMEDKAIHVAVSGIDSQTETRSVPQKESQTISTQTDKKKKIKEARNAQQKWVEHVQYKVDDDDIIINNIVCPPPMFYNCDASPSIKIDKHLSCASHEDLSVEDLSEIASFDGEGLKLEKPKREIHVPEDYKEQFYVAHPKQNRQSGFGGIKIPQARVGETVQGLQVAPHPDAVFPLLTALINELSCIQNPQLLLNVSNRMQAASSKLQSPVKPWKDSKKEQGDKLSPSVVSAVAAALTKKLETSKENITVDNTVNPSKPQIVGTALKSQRPNINKKDSVIQKQSSQGTQKKTKLVFGLTNTQRLRLQKANPQWLKSIEKEEAELRAKRQSSKKPSEVHDVNAATFSDTLTEVRRLAEIELNSTAGGDTLLNIASEVDDLDSTLGKARKSDESPPKPHRSVSGATRNSLRKSKQDESIRKSPGYRRSRKTPSPKAKARLRQRRSSQQREITNNSSDSDELLKKKPVPLERHMRDIASPLVDQDFNTVGNDEPLSARSDLPSSRSRSIEVRLPSAEPDLEDSGTITDAENSEKDDIEEDEVDIPLPDDSMTEKPKVQVLNFPKYIARDSSLPESIAGKPNGSLDISHGLDDDSPLESTRHSRNLTSDQNDSRVLLSTDYDTRQFHSTDEPELQELVSEEENPSNAVDSGRRSVASVRTSQKFPIINPQLSESSPVPSVRRSTTKLDPVAHSYLPSVSYSKGQVSPVSSRPSTPKGNARKLELQAVNPRGSGVITPRTSITPRSASASPKRPVPHPRRPMRESIHTDSLSSYMPSDPENVIVSLSSNSGMYSDDFQPLGSADSGEGTSSVEQLPKIIPNAKLAYTIN